MSRRSRAAALFILAPLVLGGCACDDDDDRTRLEDRLDGTPVQFHVAIRELLSEDGSGAFMRDLAAAAEARDAAERVARAAYDRRAGAAERLRADADAELAPVLPALRAGADAEALPPGHTLGDAAQHERALLLLGMLVVLGRDGTDAVPAPVLLYEAWRLDPEALRASVRPFLHAMRAWAYSHGGLCDLASEEGRRAMAEPDAAVVERAVARLTERGATDPEAILADLGRVRRLLGDGARACCDIRGGAHHAAAERFEPRLDDAAGLDIDAPRLALLRAWVALEGGDAAVAQSHIADVREADLRVEDRPRYKMLRDTLAVPDPASADDALARLVDRRWLSQLILQAALDALERDGLLGALELSAASREAISVAAGEGAALDAAREMFPFFDRADDKDRDLLRRFRRWLGME